MQTQFERLRALFDEMNVKYTVSERDALTVIETDNGIGYNSFFSEYHFNSEGVCVAYGVWE